MSENKDLAIIADVSEDQWPSVYVKDGLRPFIEQVKAAVMGEAPDLSTDKGRKRIASLAAKVSKSKAAIEKPGRDYLRKLKEMPKTVEAELREFVKEMDQLRDEVRQPLTEFEQAEKARIAKHEAVLDWLGLMGSVADQSSSAEIAAHLASIEDVEINESLDEYEAEAHRAKAKSVESVKDALAAMQNVEAERAELESLRKAQAEQARKDEIAAAEKSASALARQHAIEESVAKERASKAEQDRIERDHQIAIERAQREKAEAEAAGLREKEQAELRQRQAVEAERAKIASEQARQQADQEAREKDRDNKARIHNDILADLFDGGFTEDQAKTVITLIAKNKVRHTKINY